MLAMPWIATGVFVFQSYIAESKMWSIYTIPKAFMVFSTAFGTAVFGLLIDNGFTIENIALIAGMYIVISLILLIMIRKTLEPIKLKK